MKIRIMEARDIEAATDLQQRVYSAIPPFTRQQFESLLEHFPQGQFVAELDGRIVGLAVALVVMWDDYSLHHTWDSVTNNGFFDTHDMSGRTLYGAEVCVDPDVRHHGVGHGLYEARRRLCRAMNLKRIIAGGRLPGYHKVAQRMPPEEYAKRVVWGDIYDPVLRFQLGEGFNYCGILKGYLPADDDSLGNAALIVWLNPDFDAERPTTLPPANQLQEGI
ncbi:MAG: GNAT family N-acetyltransferase [Sideroxydans sp.]|nr:GNAT family N-acetyltransferase [Sideroxydans sp.]